MALFLGIDTSCYTTSVAVVDERGKLISENRKVLPVKEGERGLAQSQALFYHVQNFPFVLEEVLKGIPDKIAAVCASVKPRNLKDSYMPVFTFGESVGRSLAAALKVNFIPTSHQEGHLMAGIWSSSCVLPEKFLAVHLSGGTSEILLVETQKKGFNILKIGSSKDLHAGQFVDRVGVSLGLSFPAGPGLEKLASKAQGHLKIPSAVDGLDFSFSGPETNAQRLIKEGYPKEEIARAVENCISKTLEKTLRLAIENTGLKSILLVGGVAANKKIRENLYRRLTHRAVGAKLYFAKPEHSTDNAVGVALMGRKIYFS